MMNKVYPDDLFNPCDGPMPDKPFGYDLNGLKNVDVPAPFLGSWFRQGAQADPARDLVIEPHQITYPGSGVHPIVGVFLDDRSFKAEAVQEITMLVQVMDLGKWLFGMYLLGVSADGATLTNMESQDMRWVRR